MAQVNRKFIADNAAADEKIRLDNNSTLRSRNAANSADVDILKVNASDEVSVGSNLVNVNLEASNMVVSANQLDIETTGSNLTIDSAGNLSLTANTSTVDLFGDASTAVSLKFYDNNNSNYVGLKAPGTVSVNASFTLPGVDGTSGQVLSTDGSGNLSFVPAGGGGATTELDNLTTTDINADLLFNKANALIKTKDASAATEKLLIRTGDSSAAKAGDMEIFTGSSAANFNTGKIDISTDSATGTGNAGAIVLSTGVADSGNGGDVEIYAGSSTSGTHGKVVVSGQFVDILDGFTSASGTLRIFDDTQAEYLAFTSPTGLAASVTWTLPTSDGNSGEVLFTNGSGVLGWSPIRTWARETFTLSAGDITAGNVVLTNSPVVESVILVASGLVSDYGTDYSITGNTLDFSTHTPAFIAGDVINVQYQY